MSSSLNNGLDHSGQFTPGHGQPLCEATDMVRGFDENVSPCRNNEKRDNCEIPLNEEQEIPHLAQSTDQAAPISTDLRCQPELQSSTEGLSGFERTPFAVNEDQADQSSFAAQNRQPAGISTSSVYRNVGACSTYTDLNTSHEWAASGDFELFDDFDLFEESEAHRLGDENTTDLTQPVIGYDTAIVSTSGCEEPTLNGSSTSCGTVELNTSASPSESELFEAPTDTSWNGFGIFNISSSPSSSALEKSVDREPLETPDTPWTPRESNEMDRLAEQNIELQEQVKRLLAQVAQLKSEKTIPHKGDVDEACDMRSTLDTQQHAHFQNEEEVVKTQHKSQILHDLEDRAKQKRGKFRRKKRLNQPLRIMMLKKRLKQRVFDCLGVSMDRALARSTMRNSILEHFHCLAVTGELKTNACVAFVLEDEILYARVR